MTAKYKPGSRVQLVWEVYESKGAEAAYNHGLTMDLKATTLKSWVRMWAKELGQDAPSIKTAIIPVNSEVAISRHKRVYAKYWPERLGVLLSAGPEVSHIRWDDGSTADHYLTNRLIVEVTEKKNAD